MHLLLDNVCDVGTPQVSRSGEQVFCGKGPNREDCKAGYECKVDSVDRYAVCCPKSELYQFTLHTPYRAYVHSYSQNSGQMIATVYSKQDANSFLFLENFRRLMV